jgi:hypothetical protein
MNKKEIGALLMLAWGCFPTMQEKSMAPVATSWQETLSDIPYDEARKALIKVLQTSKFFPTVADIREKVEANKKSAYPKEVIEAVKFSIYKEYDKEYFIKQYGEEEYNRISGGYLNAPEH